MKRPALTFGPEKLELTDDQFHALHVSLDRTRKNARTVTLDKEAVRILLSDHSRLYAHIEEIEHALRSPRL